MFIGSYAADRNNDIRAFCEAARSIGLEIDFRLASKKIEEEKAALGIPEVEFFSFENALSYRQNLEEAAKSSVLVDFLNRKHYGLSLRIFEAIGLDKKTDYDQSDHRTLRFLSPEQYVLLEWKQP